MNTPIHPIMDDPLSDFRNFVYLVWHHLYLPDPTDLQYDICDYLQNGPSKRFICGFRGIAKTWLTGTYGVWRLLRDPQKKIVVCSASKTHADNITTFMLGLINTMPELSHLRPKNEQRSAKDSFDVGPASVDVAPSVRAVGITGQKTGGRADVVIMDDIETPENSMTHGMREKISEAVKEFAAIIKPDAEIIYLGTPQVESSLYLQLPGRGYDSRFWPARFPTPDLVAHLGESNISPYIMEQLKANPSLAYTYGEYGSPTEPQRFTHEDLLSREKEYGKSGFTLQFMLNTKLSDAERYPLKVKDLIVMDVNPFRAPENIIWASSPELRWNDDVPNVALSGDYMNRPMRIIGDFIEYTGGIMYVDPSGRGKDETAFAIVKILNGFLYLLKVGGYRDGYSDETLDGLVNTAMKYKVNKVIIEDNFGDGMFLSLLKPHFLKIDPKTGKMKYPVALEGVKVTGQKEARIISIMEPILNQHRLVVDKQCIIDDFLDVPNGMTAEKQRSYRFIHQLTRITKDRGSLPHDDRLDAVTGACSYWVQALARDVDRSMEERKERLLKEELEKFHSQLNIGAIGRPSGFCSW